MQSLARAATRPAAAGRLLAQPLVEPLVGALRRGSAVQASLQVKRPQHLKFDRHKKPRNELEKLLLLEERDVIGTFLAATVDRAPSTEQTPNLVPSLEASRLIACHCDAEGFDIKYTMLHKPAGPTRCACGHWFKLVDALSPFSAQKGATMAGRK